MEALGTLPGVHLSIVLHSTGASLHPEQLAAIRQPTSPRIHPAGNRVAFVIKQIDLEDDWYVNQIWMWDEDDAVPFTAGPADKAPLWAPDGHELAFLRAPDPGEKSQLAVMPADGGEPTVLTDFELGVKELAWSPDGSQIAVVATEWIPELQGLEEEERQRRARRITRLPFRADNRGWTHDRRDHIWLIDAASDAPPTCLTPGDHDESSIVWSPDGAEIAFLSPRHPQAGLESGRQVFTVGKSGGEAVARTETGEWVDLSFDRAGHLYATGHPDRWAYPTTMGLYRLDDDGAVALTADLDRNVVFPIPPTEPAGPQWLDDGTARLLVEDAGKVTINSLTVEGQIAELVAGRQAVSGFSFTADASAAAFVASTTSNPGELWRWEGGQLQQLTRLNEQLAASMVDPTPFTIEHEDATIEGWIYVPPGSDEVPTLLNIHGGPAAQYGWGFFDEFQVYVGAGYGIVAINPRGSSGYGVDHVRAIVDEWQNPMPPDLRDLLVAVDTAAEVEPRLDTERVGVMGGSYGGLATVRVLAADQRYKSAIAERGVYVWNSFSGTSDIGPWFTQMYLGRGVLDSQETMWDASSLKGFSAISTPTLIIHSEDDFRCPIEQAEQLFAAMLRSGTEVELLRFPGPESHELSRSGKPKHRVERFEAILDWHGRHL